MTQGKDAERTGRRNGVQPPAVRLGPGGQFNYEWDVHDGDEDVADVLPLSCEIQMYLGLICRAGRWVWRGLRRIAYHALGWSAAVRYHRKLRVARRQLRGVFDLNLALAMRSLERARRRNWMIRFAITSKQSAIPRARTGPEAVNYCPEELPAT